MRQRLQHLAVPCLLQLAAVTALAQDGGANEPLEEVRVVGSRLDTRQEDSTYTLTVIDSNTLRALQPASALDALRVVPGLYAQEPAGRAAPTSLFLRGADPNYTLVMIDGVPLNDPTNSRGGSFDVSSLDVNAFERIEVIRGPSSAVYGSDALAGVVNFVTAPDNVSRGVAGRVSLGTDDDYNAGAKVILPVSDNGYVRLSAAKADQGDIVPDATEEANDFLLTGRVQPGPKLTLSFIGRTANGRSSSFPEDSGGPELAVLGELDHRNYTERLAAVSADVDVGETLISASARGYDRSEDDRSPGVAPGLRDPFGIPANSSDSVYRRRTVIATAKRRFDGAEIVGGAELRNEDGISDSTVSFSGQQIGGRYALSRTTRSAFFEGRWQTAGRPFDVDFGLRWDSPDGAASEWTPRLALRIPDGPAQTDWRLSYSEGFKLPSFFALGHPFVGNPDLKPERSKSFEAGGGKNFVSAAALRLDWSLFSSRFDNLIDVDEGPPLRLVNRAEVEAKGIELSARFNPAERVELTGWVSYVDTEILNSDAVLRQRPKRLAGASLRFRVGHRTEMSLLATYTGSRYDSSVPTGMQLLHAYRLMRLNVSHRISSAIRLLAGIDNLTDEQYQEAVGFPAAGRRLHVGISVDTGS
jgi:vitamin B12 transporter